MKHTTVRALLLAAGVGSRLRPLTNLWPKCLMPIGDRPLLDYWLEALRLAGIRDVLVNTHYSADNVRKFLAREKYVSWVNVAHEIELLGTAGTLRSNYSFFQNHETLLIHADNWSLCNLYAFIDYHFNRRPRHCLITMMTFDTDTPKNCGIVETDENNVVIRFHEKVDNPPTGRANAAVYLVSPQIQVWLHNNPQVKDFRTEVLPNFIGRIATWHNTGVHRDIGTIASLRAAQFDPKPRSDLTESDEWQRNFEKSYIYRSIMNNILNSENSND